MAYLYFSHDKITNKMSGVHAHKNHELYYLAKGNTKYLIGDEIYAVEAGSVVFVPRGIYHMTDSGGNPNIERYLISFGDDMFDDDTRLLLDELIACRLINIPVNRIDELKKLFSSLESSVCKEDELSAATKKIKVLSILSYICRHKREYVNQVSESDKIVHDISEYVKLHYGDDLNLSLLSRMFSVSESHLSRKFKSVSGVGLTEYITFVRIMNAERLLKNNNITIIEVAELCGFNDSNYFSTVFKKIKGITPLKFSKIREE